MGCIWSKKVSHERCRRCGTRGDETTHIIDHLCERCIPKATSIEVNTIRLCFNQNPTPSIYFRPEYDTRSAAVATRAVIPTKNPTPSIYSRPEYDTRSAAVATRAVIPTKVQNSQACYGEYKCICGRFWPSRQSWPGKWQKCKRCKKQVKAHIQRELRQSDWSKENFEKHERELCEMCLQLGSDCGAFRAKNHSTQKKPYSAHKVTSTARKTYPTRKFSNSVRKKTHTSRALAHRKW